MSNKRTSRKGRQDGGDAQGRGVFYGAMHDQTAAGNRAVMPMHLGAYPLPYNQYGGQGPLHGSPRQPPVGYSLPFHPLSAPTPPSKRPRTDARGRIPRNTGDLVRTPQQQHGHAQQAHTRRTFSDFRIARLSIGTWTDISDPTGTRDSRLRFYFRNAGDREASPSLSAAEQALSAPDRVSISCCNGTQRIIIPAHHVKQVVYERAEGTMLVETDGWAAFQKLEMDETRSDSELGRWVATEDDLTGGQLAVAKKIRLILDRTRPLTEPKWARAATAGEGIEASSRFAKITRVVDVRPDEQFERLVTGWAHGSEEREQFVQHLCADVDGLVGLSATSLAARDGWLPALERLLETLVKLTGAPERSGVEQQVTDALKVSMLALPAARMSQALEQRFLATTGKQEATEPGGYGFKRQRGESEVPSDALARATLDEKRRRLSESGRGRVEMQDRPQTPNRKASNARGEAVTTPKSAKAEQATSVTPSQRRARRSESADGRLTLRPPWSRPLRYFEQDARVTTAAEDEEDNIPIIEGAPDSPMRRRRHSSVEAVVLRRLTEEEPARMSREEHLAMLELQEAQAAEEDAAAAAIQGDSARTKRHKRKEETNDAWRPREST